VIAAGAGIAAPLISQDQQNERDDRRVERQETRDALASARLMTAELLASEGQMLVLRNDRYLRPFDETFAVEVPAGDLHSIAAELKDPERWGAVLLALTAVDQLQTFVNTLLERGRQRLTKGELCYLDYDIYNVRLAADALADLAMAADTTSRAVVPTCSPEPGPVFGG
jgi:hypothetical protein